MRLFIVFLFLFSQFALTGCAHKNAINPFSSAELQNKRLALIEIKGLSDEKSRVETAVLNEIAAERRFQLVDRKIVQNALAANSFENDWQQLGRKIGADYLLSLRVNNFIATESHGVKNSKIYEGTMRLTAIFYDVESGAIVYQGMGAANESTGVADKTKLLEKLTAKSARDALDRIPK
jgi:hypothetical protein